MRALPRLTCALGLSAVLAALVVLAQPDPPRAQANVACDVGSGPAGAVTGGVGAITGGAIGGGNPVGDVCNEVTDDAVGAVSDPITGALEGVGNTIFSQITVWTADGASWLIGRVVELIEESTTPKLTTKGFLATYAKMALIGALLASAMLLLAVLEGIARGDMGMLVRVVFVNLPLALIATSVAYVIVQLLLVATDGLCHAIGSASQHSSNHFFKGAIEGLGEAGGTAGETVGGAQPGGGPAGKAAGEVAAPLFVSFLAAIIGGFAAFFVWVELLMRDAAVYVVSLFMPLALAGSIWPRWSGAMRRTGELIAVVIASKFVIVSIIALAAGLVAEDGAPIEHILAAAALMLLACFAPFALFRLVPFAEGAIGAAYGRRHAGASTMGGARTIASSAQTMRRTATASWRSGSPGSGSPGSAGPARGAAAKGGAGGVAGSGARGAAGAGAGKGAAVGGAAAAGGLAAAGTLPVAAVRGAQAAAQRLGGSGIAQTAGGEPGRSEAEWGGGEQQPAATSAPKSGSGGSGDKGQKVARPPSEPARSPDKMSPGSSTPAPPGAQSKAP